MSLRHMSENERAVLELIAAHDFPGAPEIQEQLRVAEVESSCDCGCGSIRFAFADPTSISPSPAESPLPVRAAIVDAEGTEIGGVAVLLRDGLLNDADVHSRDLPLSFPDPACVRYLA